MQTEDPPPAPASESASNVAQSAVHRAFGIAEIHESILLSLVWDADNFTTGMKDFLQCRLVSCSWYEAFKAIINSNPMRWALMLEGAHTVKSDHESRAIAPVAWRDFVNGEHLYSIPRELGGRRRWGTWGYFYCYWDELEFHPTLADVFVLSTAIDDGFQGDKRLSRGMYVFDGDICPSFDSGCCEGEKPLKYTASSFWEHDEADGEDPLLEYPDDSDEVKEIRLSITKSLTTWLKESAFFGYSSNPVTLFDLIPYHKCYLTDSATCIMAFYFGGWVDKTNNGVTIPMQSLHECMARSKDGIRIGHLIVACALRHHHLKWGQTKRGFVFDDEHMILIEEEEDWFCSFSLEVNLLPADRTLWISKIEGRDTFDPANREGVIVNDLWEGLEMLGYDWINSYYHDILQGFVTNDVATVPATER